MTEVTMRVGVILGSVRTERDGLYILEWILNHLKSYDNIEPVVLDIKQYNLPFFGDIENKSLSYPWKEDTGTCDAFIFLTPEFNHSMSGALKNALDLLDWELHHKPAGFIGYGLSANGARAVEHLKSVCDSYSMMLANPNLLISVLEEIKGELFQPREWQNNMAKTMINEIVDLYKYSKDYLDIYNKERIQNTAVIHYNDEWTGFDVPGIRGFIHTHKKNKF